MNYINIIVGIAGIIIGLAFNYKNTRRNEDKDIKEDTKEDTKSSTELKVKLDYISKGVDDIRLDIKSTNREIDTIKATLIRVDESTKSAHKRIDELKKKEEK